MLTENKQKETHRFEDGRLNVIKNSGVQFDIPQQDSLNSYFIAYDLFVYIVRRIAEGEENLENIHWNLNKLIDGFSNNNTSQLNGPLFNEYVRIVEKHSDRGEQWFSSLHYLNHLLGKYTSATLDTRIEDTEDIRYIVFGDLGIAKEDLTALLSDFNKVIRESYLSYAGLSREVDIVTLFHPLVNKGDGTIYQAFSHKLFNIDNDDLKDNELAIFLVVLELLEDIHAPNMEHGLYVTICNRVYQGVSNRYMASLNFTPQEPLIKTKPKISTGIWS